MRLPPLFTLLVTPIFYLASCGMLATFFMPPRGFGGTTCALRNITGLPCFGCGMTRAVTCISHGEFEWAWQYHPFSYLVWPFVMVLAVGGIYAPFRRAFLRWSRAQDAWLSPVFWAGVAAFVAFGFGRSLDLVNWQRFV